MAKQNFFSSGRLALAAGLLAAVFSGASVAAGFGADPTAGKRTPDAAPSAQWRSWTYQTLDYPGAAQTIFWGLDDFGGLAGQYTIAGGVAHAMTYRHGKFRPLDPDKLGTYFSAAGGPDDAGTTFGGYADAAGTQHGFVIRRGRFETVDFPGHLNSNVDAVDGDDTILGVYWDADHVFHGMLSRNGNQTPIDVAGARDTYPLGLNSKGDSVGYWDSEGSATHGYVRRADGQVATLDVPDAAATVAFAINDRGQVAGYFTDKSGALHGFVRTGHQFQQLDMPGAVATIVTALNNCDSVAGEYFDAGGVRHGFMALLK
ncbi:MAG: hypothetical protein ACJ8IK_24185 [Burkholderiaceae bacterium]